MQLLILRITGKSRRNP